MHVVPGSGDSFYCENCVRDNTLVRALQKTDNDVVVVPMYLPQRNDRLDAGMLATFFFGGINATLQQNFSFFRKTPRWIDRMFDARWLLGLAARGAGSVRSAGLEEMTLSMLRGKDGNQAKELERLIRWLEGERRPDVVHLSNAFLLGVGSEIKERLHIPIVCSLQDEDDWIRTMESPYPDRCLEVMSHHARNVDAFVAASRVSRDFMQDWMNLDAGRLHVVPVGMDCEAYPRSPLPRAPAVIGYLARMSESLGLGILTRAFLQLKQIPSCRDVRLHLSGGFTADDRPFFKEMMQDLSAQGVAKDVKVFPRFDLEARKAFFKSLTVFSVPAVSDPAFGTFLVESMAAGVPVVQPRSGSFPGLVEATGGGVLVDPNDADSLARALGDLLADPRRLSHLGEQGVRSVRKKFSTGEMVRRLLEVYNKVAAHGGSPERRET